MALRHLQLIRAEFGIDASAAGLKCAPLYLNTTCVGCYFKNDNYDFGPTHFLLKGRFWPNPAVAPSIAARQT